MRRRDVIAGFGAAAGSAILSPHLVSAQSPHPAVGFLGSGSRDTVEGNVRGFLAGLKQAGFADGQNLTIEYRWAGGRYEQLPKLAEELVQLPVNVLFAAQGNVSALAAKRATSSVPIVFSTADDPVATGLVASLGRPGGNLTGVARLGTLLGAKNLELLHELLPSVSPVALLVNPKRPTADVQIKGVRDAAQSVGKTVRILSASDDREVQAAFETIVSERIGALVVAFDAVLNARRSLIVALAARHAVPAAYSTRESVSDGGLMSYGDNGAESYRLGGDLVARILKGAKPADLPVQQASKLELVINLKTARALGLTIPITLLGRADEVIE